MDQKVIRSHPNANRQENMIFFADAAAELAANVIQQQHSETIIGSMEPKDDGKHGDPFRGNGDDGAIMLDRATHLRSSDEETLRKLEKKAKYVVLRGANQILADANDTTKPAFLTHNEAESAFGGRPSQTTFLGTLTNSNKTPILALIY